MLRIRELFKRDVTRDIPPVIYFHEQSPEKLAAEVGEYIITGGYRPDDPRYRRVPVGIHEQLKRLLTNIKVEVDRPGGSSEPACWLSGFYGSGKSSFAKLLGLALDGKDLPDGTPLCDALVRRDTSPLSDELRAAWDALITTVDPIACVFDIGGMARDNEHIHAAVTRQVQARLGYSKHALVAAFELRLERDGLFDAFCAKALDVLGRPWSEARLDAFADDHFSEVMHRLQPERYTDPMTWVDTWAGQGERGLAPDEATQAIADMLAYRQPDKHLFIVVDEVSQYIHQDEQRMLRLQSFVSSLKERLKGRVWLLVTGQEKLEEETGSTVLGKMQDRFPPHLRVHLATTNIRDVVHRRLLEKADAHKQALRDAFERHRTDLRLYAYDCDALTAEEFVEVYPLLPGHIDLLLQITTAMRTRSTRVQGDDHAIRGLLQLLGELFRAQNLAEAEMGTLITLDTIYAVQQTALDSDVQASMQRVHDHCAREDEPDALRAAQAVALLELIQDQVPTSADLVARCLYDRLDRGDRTDAVEAALERLRAANLLGYSEKQGYKLQSSAGQEWDKERRDVSVTPERQHEIVREKLARALGDPDRPRLQEVPFPWLALFSDDLHAVDVRLKDTRADAAIVVDFRLARSEAGRADGWAARSAEPHLDGRLVWVAGAPDTVLDNARELARSYGMLARYRPRRESLTRDKQRLLFEEEARAEDLDKAVQRAVEAAWMDGRLYFKGRPLQPRDQGSTFATALLAAGNAALPDIYPHFVRTTVTEGELNELLADTLSGVSPKFLEGDLGIISLDAGRYVATCSGRVPAGILKHIDASNGLSGATLFQHFGRPPFGYAPAVLRACLAGMLHAHKVRVRPKGGAEITSIRDPGVKELFRRERDLRNADIFPGKEGPVTGKDRVAVAKMFERAFGIEVARENDALADAAFQHFPGAAERLRTVLDALNRLPGGPPTPDALTRLHKALEDARRSRQIEPTVIAIKRHLDALNDGLQLLGIYAAELTDDAVDAVRQAADVHAHQAAQLADAGALDPALTAARDRLATQLAAERPWQGIKSLDDDLAALSAAYRAARERALARHDEAIDATFDRLRQRPGFADLTDTQQHELKRIVASARLGTSADAIAPALADLDDRFAAALSKAEQDAHRRLDDLIDVRTLETRLGNKVIRTPEQLDALLADLRTRVLAQLEANRTVRLV